MTNTLYQNIQALGNRMADNLTTMGISSSFGEGGLTLADKILQIQHFTNGVLLFADNNIAQSGDTDNFYALVLNEGKPVSGATVVFYDPLHPTITHDGNGVLNANRNIGNSFSLYYDAQSSQGIFFYLESSDTQLIYESNGDVKLKTGAIWETLFTSSGFIQLDNGILSDDLGHTYDLSSNNTNFTITQVFGACRIYLSSIGVDVTGSNGIASVAFTCTGAGKRNVVAKSGSLVSEPYEVYDYINYDNGLDGDCSNIWTGNTEDLSRQTDGSLFSSISARKLLSSALIHGDFEATFEAIGTGSPLWGVQDSSSNMTRFYIANSEDFRYYKITRANGTITAKTSTGGTSWTNLTAQTSNVTSADCYFMLQNNSGTKSIKFKNVKIYPI